MSIQPTDKPKNNSWLVKFSALSALFVVFPGSFLLFLPVESLFRAAAEAMTWLGAIGCVFAGLCMLIVRIWRQIWPR